MRNSGQAIRFGLLAVGAAGAVAASVIAGPGIPFAAAAPGDPFTPQPNTWCPGRMGPMGFTNLGWDPNVCHTWYTVPFGMGNVPIYDLQGNAMRSPILADVPAPTLTPAPPPPPPPPHPFCTPRGALIIIPPICDEIGVDLPQGSVSGG